MKPDEIRQSYLDFFEDRGHEVVQSAPVIPENDPTLLFTNAGMNQFKDLLLGNETRDYNRATSVQKCMRAGGKHNDLDEVGKDGRHLTFFEMLGNWSFGDYYKRQAIEWAWEYLLDVLELDPERLYVTVYKDDDDSYDIWADEIDFPEDKILRLGDIEKGDEENFWSMGPTGPCGPCTEIHYDKEHGEKPLEFVEGYDEERVTELWNLVFMEYNRTEQGDLEPLPMKSVDTGLGLDRVAMVMAGVDNIFKTELFKPVFRRTAKLLGRDSIDWDSFYDSDDFSNYAVIADHIRSLLFSLCDGAQFSNEGRGYVLRRILRRAVRFGKELGFDEPFLCDVAPAIVESYGHVYPELEATGEEAAELIKIEEERFFRNIDRGIALFEEAADEAEQEGRDHLTGQEVFDLHATYGFPPDLTEIMAEERGLAIDWNEYKNLWAEHQEKSKADDMAQQGGEVGEWNQLRDNVEASQFVGYDNLETKARIVQYRHLEDDTYDLILTETPFYAEAGGQIGDSGTVRASDGDIEFRVRDTQSGSIGTVHRVELERGIVSDETLSGVFVARVDGERREKTAANHTATHLLHAALRELISEDIFQSGSLVSNEKLRFDFSYEKPLTPEQIRKLEDRVNDYIRRAVDVREHRQVDRDRAVNEMGAMAIFGEKYGEQVRVIEIPDESVELCGGTHVDNTSEINLFRIEKETGAAAGVRRIVAVTKQRAYKSFQQDRDTVRRAAETIGADKRDLLDRLESFVDKKQELSRQVDKLSQKFANQRTSEIADNAERVDGVAAIAQKLDVESRDQLLQFADELRQQIDVGTALLMADIGGSPALLVMVTEEATERGLDAGDLINEVAPIVDGNGGGRPTLAQGGGATSSKIPDALEAFPGIVEEMLG